MKRMLGFTNKYLDKCSIEQLSILSTESKNLTDNIEQRLKKIHEEHIKINKKIRNR
jgi:hypothetical protein